MRKREREQVTEIEDNTNYITMTSSHISDNTHYITMTSLTLLRLFKGVLLPVGAGLVGGASASSPELDSS